MMAAFLFVTASIVVVIGVMGMAAGHVVRTARRQQGRALPMSPDD